MALAKNTCLSHGLKLLIVISLPTAKRGTHSTNLMPSPKTPAFHLATDYGDISRLYLRLPIIASPKLNGVRARWCRDRRELVSRDGKVFRRDITPGLYAELDEVEFDLDGELYLHGTPLPEIAGALSIHRTAPSDLSARIEYHVFDFPNLNMTQAMRTHALVAWSPGGSRIKVVPHVTIREAAGIDDIYEAFVREGYEGVVYKNIAALYFNGRTPYWIKRKAWLEMEARVIALKPGGGQTNRDSIGALECMTPAGVPFNVTLTEITERTWWMGVELKSAPLVKVRYLELTTGGVPHQPIYEGRV